MSFDVFFQNAVQLHQSGKLDEAEAAYRQLLDISPENTDLLYLLGMIAVQKGAYEAGINYLYQAVKLSPDSIAYHFTLAHALQEAGHPKEAMERYKSVLQMDPSLPETYNNMGIISRRQGETTEAVSYFKQALEKNASFAPAYVNLALIERDEGDFDQAVAHLDKAISIAPDDAEAYAQKAATLRLTHKAEEAIELYQKALEIEQDNPVYWNGLGISYEQTGENEKALEAYDRALSIDARYADVYNNRANIYAKIGKHWPAEDDFKTAIKIDPKFVEAYNNLGALLYEHERYEEALECYRKAFIINPKQAETSNNLAMAVRAAGNLEEAIGLYFNALVLNPLIETVHHNLAQALYDLYVHEKQPDNAKKLAQKWLESYPDNPIARHLNDAFSEETISRATSAYIKNHFDSFSETFEKTLQNISYRVPELIKNELEGYSSNLRILDAGCGTGICAEILKPYAATLIGVDLSEKMIEKARQKKLYDELVPADLIFYLNEKKSAFDLCVLADVACYFGDLTELFAEVYASLTPKGRMLCTLEETTKKEYLLQPSGRFAHKRSYVETLLKKTGFHSWKVTNEVLRLEDDVPVNGFFITALKEDL